MIRRIAQDTSKLYAEQDGYDVKDVGYMIDESAHLKKGNDSAGVARQYAGVIGKVELLWDNKEEHARKRVLVISRNNESNQIKYGLAMPISQQHLSNSLLSCRLHGIG